MIKNMKIRNGFVSNSSSSSYIIRKENLTNEQIDMIKDHINYCWKLINDDNKKIASFRKFNEDDPYGEEENRKNDEINYSKKTTIDKLKEMMGDNTPYRITNTDKWDVIEKDNVIETCTDMDNFPMDWFLTQIVKVDESDIIYKEY
mgnify:CR=1 FL=1